MEDRLYLGLREIVGEENCKTDVSMSGHTTFRIGGNAKYFVTPQKEEEIRDVIRFCNDNSVNYFIIGNGSNLLVSDNGLEGVVIKIAHNFSKMEVKGNRIVAQSGVLLSKLANQAKNHGLTGLEFAGGIPGTLGGAITMNAGAYGGEMKDIVTKVRVLTKEGDFLWIQAADMDFSYRHSVVTKEGYVVLEVEVELKEGNEEAIRLRMEELKEQRVSKQPLEFPSAGSTFKRPEGHFAGKLIMDADLRGYTVGGAKVSEKHCGFVINAGKASAKDVMTLIEHIQKTVWEKFGVKLETEVKILGDM